MANTSPTKSKSDTPNLYSDSSNTQANICNEFGWGEASHDEAWHENKITYDFIKYKLS